MELKLLCEKALELFNIDSIDELRGQLENTVLENDIDKLKAFKELQEDLNEDLLQKIFQYYEADRDVKKQDYTPKTLAKLTAKLSIGDTVTDICAGSGALTIQSWAENKTAKHICIELDENVIPFLMFNMALRNMEGAIVVGDVIQNRYWKQYNVQSGEEFSTVTLAEDVDVEITDCCISNPPYNLKWEQSPMINFDSRFTEYGIPPKGNANYVFVLTALEKCSKGAFILPNGVLTTSDKCEKEIIKNLVENKVVKAIILCPDRMFEATSIGTCVILFDKGNSDSSIEMIDLRRKGTKEVREQNGQFGGKSHTGRTYKKEINVLSDDLIEEVQQLIESKESKTGYCKSVSTEEIRNSNYGLIPSLYIELEEEENTTRSYEDIVNDLNRVIKEKNKCKLTISETLAKQLGFDLELFKAQDDSELNNLLEKIAGQKIVKDNYFRTTKNKNEVKFENGSKEEISSIFMMIFNMWKQHIYYLNNEENRYLAELRDKMLPDLMAGRIELKGENNEDN